MDSKSYIKNIFLFVVFLLAATALTNFIVDPGNIYPKYYSQENKITPEVIVKKLIESHSYLSILILFIRYLTYPQFLIILMRNQVFKLILITIVTY